MAPSTSFSETLTDESLPLCGDKCATPWDLCCESPAEIAVIREAYRIADLGVEAALDAIAPGVTERAVAAATELGVIVASVGILLSANRFIRGVLIPMT